MSISLSFPSTTWTLTIIFPFGGSLGSTGSSHDSRSSLESCFFLVLNRYPSRPLRQASYDVGTTPRLLRCSLHLRVVSPSLRNYDPCKEYLVTSSYFELHKTVRIMSYILQMIVRRRSPFRFNSRPTVPSHL